MNVPVFLKRFPSTAGTREGEANTYLPHVLEGMFTARHRDLGPIFSMRDSWWVLVLIAIAPHPPRIILGCRLRIAFPGGVGKDEG